MLSFTVIMGQDILNMGVFKITDGFLEEFGKKELEIRPFVNLLVVQWVCL